MLVGLKPKKETYRESLIFFSLLFYRRMFLDTHNVGAKINVKLEILVRGFKQQSRFLNGEYF